MILLADVMKDTNGAFEIFSHGERHIDEFLEPYLFRENGVRDLWEMFDHLSENVLNFMQCRFPMLGERERAACCALQMSQLREKIMRLERKQECYRSILAMHAA